MNQRGMEEKESRIKKLHGRSEPTKRACPLLHGVLGNTKPHSTGLRAVNPCQFMRADIDNDDPWHFIRPNSFQLFYSQLVV